VRLVLCDDHRLLAEALATALRANGHQVVAVTTTPEAGYRAVVEHRPDVCLLDVGFPGASGLDVITRMTSACDDCKVLILSGRSNPDMVNAALTAGAAGFVVKEQGIDRILQALDRVLEGQAVVESSLLRAALSLPMPLRSPEGQRLHSLTSREREALGRIAAGDSTKEIARAMHVSESTARTHVQNVLTKLGVRSRLQAAALVAREGLPDEFGNDPG
jgi:two-component system, NarL family, nitrate/nitrite response regulator NarL